MTILNVGVIMKKTMKYPVMLASLLVVAASAVSSYADVSAKPSTKLLAQTENLEADVLNKALTAFNNAVEAGITDSQILTVIDYSKASSEPRLWVFDLAQSKLLFEELVAHGRGSGDNYAKNFSNTPQSYQTSLGVFLTDETYQGGNGYSLRLDGLEEGINHLARERAIVIHGANYVNESFVDKNGRLGRSHGCPAVGLDVNKELINTIKGGSLVVAYYPNEKWINESKFLN
jgi:hypothetical protein